MKKYKIISVVFDNYYSNYEYEIVEASEEEIKNHDVPVYDSLEEAKKQLRLIEYYRLID